MARNVATNNTLAMLMIVLVICSTFAEFHDAIHKRVQPPPPPQLSQYLYNIEINLDACIKQCNKLYPPKSKNLKTCHENCNNLKECFQTCKILHRDNMEKFERCIKECHNRFPVLL
ncbi:uncharacterized protein DS421_6g196880 [Arachis hypogaea]|nr:uncharacterized protein DS421_6g196880 [Arachis hypogaea]